MMAKLKLLDTGYVANATRSGKTQIAASLRAGWNGTTSVSALELDTDSIVRSRSVSTENNPTANTTTDSPTSLVSVQNKIFKVTGTMSRVPVTTGYKYNNQVQFEKMEETRGLKILYPTDITDTLPTIVYGLGAVNTGSFFSAASPSEQSGTVATTIPYLIGRVKNIKLTDDCVNKNRLKFEFDFEVCG